MNIEYKAYSFDVFDTCISRTYEKPTDLFFHLGQLIAPQKTEHISANDFAEIFMKARITAEKKAYKANGRKKSCKMYEIYSLLEIPNYCSYSKLEIMQLEKKLEYENSYSIKKVQSIVSELRNKNKKIIFISDMYLDNEFIKSLLIKHDFFLPQDKLYVSSDLYLTKRSGDLYRHVLQKEGLSPHEMLHHGDNLFSDFVVAKKNGIDAVHIDYTKIIQQDIIFPENLFNPEIRRVNSIAKHLRLSTLHENKCNDFYSLAAPILISFTSWAISEAARNNIKRLYFSARDGELPYKLASLLFKNSNIDYRFLYGSRKAWLLPSINLESEEWKRIAVPKKEISSLIDCLERIGFAENEILKIQKESSIEHYFFTEKTSSEKCLIKLNKILENNLFSQNLEKKIKFSRDICIKYLEQEGIFDKISWAIVDSGWTLKTQASLKRIINYHNPSIETKGLYFGLSPDCLNSKEAGKACSFTKERDIFYVKAIVIEHCFLATHLDTTIGYSKNESNVTPIFDASCNDVTDRFALYLHRYVCEYAKAVKSHGINIDIFNNTQDYLKKNIAYFLKRPHRKTLQPLSKIFVHFDIRHTYDRKIKLFKKVCLFEILEIINSFIFNRKKNFYFWPEASAEISTPLNRLILKILLKLKSKLKNKKKYKPNNWS